MLCVWAVVTELDSFLSKTRSFWMEGCETLLSKTFFFLSFENLEQKIHLARVFHEDRLL